MTSSQVACQLSQLECLSSLVEVRGQIPACLNFCSAFFCIIFFVFMLVIVMEGKQPCTFVLTASDKAKQAWGRKTRGAKENVWHFARCGKWFLFACYTLMSRTKYFTIYLSWEMHFLVASVIQPLSMTLRPSMARSSCRDREACHWKNCLMEGIFSFLFWTSSAKLNDAVL